MTINRSDTQANGAERRSRRKSKESVLISPDYLNPWNRKQ
jgi:hypothetical protein